jgi:hypothetical protein
VRRRAKITVAQGFFKKLFIFLAHLRGRIFFIQCISLAAKSRAKLAALLMRSLTLIVGSSDNVFIGHSFSWAGNGLPFEIQNIPGQSERENRVK